MDIGFDSSDSKEVSKFVEGKEMMFGTDGAVKVRFS